MANPIPFETTDAEAALQHFAPLVANIPDEQLDAWNADAEIVRVNARRAVEALAPHWGQVEQSLPAVSIPMLKEMVALALALSAAAARVFVAASPHEIRAHQSTLRPARRLALKQLEIFAELDLVPADRVRAIRENTGPVDEAQDAIAIVGIYRELHPFDDAYLAKLAADGNWLLQQLVPKGATTGKTGPSAEALLRDRLWTELNRRYDELYKAAVVIWGRRKVDEHMPSLMTRQVQRKEQGEAVNSGTNP